MRVFLGVDGGGTKTEFLLVDAAGHVIAARRSGSAYYLETGIDALRRMIADGIGALLSEAHMAAADLTFACIGLPAHGEDSALLGTLEEIAANVLARERTVCVNDMVCAWAGALAGRDGINLVAGTGSIAYGEFGTRYARAGGWGELFGDEGSAYWVAREALRVFSRMSDGRASRGALYDLLRVHFELCDDLDLCAAVYGPPALARSSVAALAPLVERAARDDPAAHRIFVDAARELADIVAAARRQLKVPPQASLPVSYSGGMFRADGALLPLFEEALPTEGRYDLVAPRLSPSAGAVLYAAKRAGWPLGEEATAALAVHCAAAVPS